MYLLRRSKIKYSQFIVKKRHSEHVFIFLVLSPSNQTKKNIVENAINRQKLTDFIKEYDIDFIVGSTGMPGGSYSLSRIPINPNELGSKLDSNRKIAILFGREGDGLNNKEIDLCDMIVSIPTDTNYPIMNITHAAAIIFYEIFNF